MATMILLPDGTGVTSVDWVAVGETYRHQCLDDDNDGTSYVKCDDNNETMIIEYANPPVAESNIDTIDTVNFVSVGKSSHRSSPSVVSISFEAPAGVSGYPELCSYDAHRSNYETINGTARATKDGTHDWDYAALESLEMICIKTFAVEVYLSYLALEVTYTAGVTDNATFFGANF